MNKKVVPMLIGGEPRETQRTIDVVNSATGERIAQVPEVDLEATILSNVSRDMRATCEEVFCLVLPVLPFSDCDDEIALADDTEFGLSACVFTRKLARGLRAAQDIKAGSVCVNDLIISCSSRMEASSKAVPARTACAAVRKSTLR